MESIYGLSYLCSDIIFVVLFPELLCVLYFGYANTYGATFGFFVGFLLRLLGGEPLISELKMPSKYSFSVNIIEWKKHQLKLY